MRLLSQNSSAILAGFFCALAFILACSIGSPVSADTCNKVSLRCTQYGNKTVAGLVINNTCLKVERIEDCTQPNPVNECNALASLRVANSQTLRDGQCHLLSNECTRYILGKCVSWRRDYRCWNGPRNMAPATLEARTYHNFDEDVVSTCGAIEGDANCTYVNTVTVEGSETRDINTRMIARAWWKRQRNFDCTNPAYQNSCDDYDANPICEVTGDPLCLEQNPDGSCAYEEVSYKCESDPSFNANCEPIAVCVGEHCSEIEQEPSTGFPEAAVWLNALDRTADENNCEAQADVDPENFSAADCVSQTQTLCEANNTPANTASGIPAPLVCSDVDVDPTALEIFAGTAMSCGMNNILSCCNSTGFNKCSVGEFDLLSYREAQTTVYLGSRCTDRFLGICVYWRHEYCAYKSKFGRVFQEQAHEQTGGQFLPRGAIDRCPALTIEHLELLDTGAMDFSEVYGDMMADMDVPVADEVIEQLNNQLGITADDVQATFE
jgi:conjugal transfer mating pair stabilization protein TraN